MIERTCVHPFIEHAQNTFQNGGSLKEVFGSIRPYQHRLNSLVKGVSADARIAHAVGLSVVGLGTIAIYEYARAKGMPLPDSGVLISGILPVRSFTPDNKSSSEVSELDQSGTEKKPIKLRGFFMDPEGGIHRGVPTWTVDDEGNETPVYREHNTGKAFPREEKKDE